MGDYDGDNIFPWLEQVLNGISIVGLFKGPGANGTEADEFPVQIEKITRIGCYMQIGFVKLLWRIEGFAKGKPVVSRMLLALVPNPFSFPLHKIEPPSNF
jgi:hypothetical protein